MSIEKEKTKTHKLSLKGSSKLVAEFFEYSINTILFQRGVYPAEDFSAVKKYGLNMLVTVDDQVKAYIKRIMAQLNKWMTGGKISKLVIVITSKETGENVERWQFDVQIFNKPSSTSSSSSSSSKKPLPPPTSSPSFPSSSSNPPSNENSSPSLLPQHQQQQQQQQEKSEGEIQKEIQSIFRQITASVTFLPQLDGACTFNVLVYADADSEVPMEWGDSDAREIKEGEKVQLRGFSTGVHGVGTSVSYRLAE